MTYKTAKKSEKLTIKKILSVFKNIFMFFIAALIAVSFIYVIEFSGLVSESFKINQYQNVFKDKVNEYRNLEDQLIAALSEIQFSQVSKELNLIQSDNTQYFKEMPQSPLSLLQDNHFITKDRL